MYEVRSFIFYQSSNPAEIFNNIISKDWWLKIEDTCLDDGKLKTLFFW
jgi:hypothetical protein